MSFGKSPDDYTELAGAAHATLVNARLACGDGDALTLNISSLHHVLSRLSDDVEAVDAGQVGAGVEKRKRDGDNRWMELATLARDCERFLRILNQVLGKYNALSAEKRKVTKLWRTVKFANGETLDLDKLRNDMGVYTQAIGLFLKLVENGIKGKVEGYMDAHGAELREIKHTLHWCIAKLLAAGEDGDGSRVLRNWRAGTRDGGLWKVVRKELVGEGWEQRVLGRHQRVIVRYVMELGERGVLDGGVSGGLGLDADDDGGLGSKSNDLTDDDSDSETESESSLDEESGTDMPLGRRRSSTVSAQSRPSAQSIGVITRKRSLDEMDSSEEEEGEEEQPGKNIQRVSTSAMKNSSDPVTPPTPITPSYAPTLDQIQPVAADTRVHLNAPVSNPMALSISNLPPLPLSRPRSRNSEHDNRLIDVQDLSEKISAALPGPTPSQSVSDILVLSSVLSDHRDDEDQDDESSVEEEGLDLLNVKSDSESESDEELRLPKVSASRSTTISALSLGLFNDSADLVLRQKDKVDLMTRSEEKELQGEDPIDPEIIVTPHPGSPNHPTEPAATTASQELIALPSTLQSLYITDKTTGPVDSYATTDLSKIDTIPPLGIPIVLQAPVYSSVAASPVKKGKEIVAPEERSDRDLGSTSEFKFENDSSAPAIESKHQEGHVEQASITRPEILSTANPTLPEKPAPEKLKMDRKTDVEPRTTQFLRPKNDSGLRAINSESSIARPQIPRTYAGVLNSRKLTPSTSDDNKISDKPSQVARAPINQLSQSQPNIRNEPGSSEAVVSPRLTAPLSSADFHYELDAVETERSREITHDDDNTEDESEHSYLIIRGATASQVSYEDEQERMQPIISQTESMESVAAALITETEPKPSDQKELVVVVDENKHSDIQEGEGEGQGIMNAWSVILSQVGDDPETSLLETSGVWAQSNPSTRPASAQQVVKEAVRKQEREDSLVTSPKERDEDQIQTRSRNVTLVGDSDDEPKPPKASELWPETMQLLPPSATASDSRPSQRSHTPESRFNDSETEGSVTVDGGSEDDPMSPIKGAMLASVILPVVSEISRGKLIEQEVNLDSDLSSSDEEASVEENPAQTDNAHSVSKDSHSSPDASKISPHQTSNTPPEPTGFREINYQSSSNAEDHEKNEPNDVEPRDHRRKQPSKRAGRSSGSSTASIAEQSWNKEVETRTKEYQTQTEAANNSETAAKTPPSPVKPYVFFPLPRSSSGC